MLLTSITVAKRNGSCVNRMLFAWETSADCEARCSEVKCTVGTILKINFSVCYNKLMEP